MLQAVNDNKPATTGGARQHTLQGPVRISGRGLLLGEEATLTILPAPPNHGIVFERTDLDPPVQIPALVTNVARRARRTTLKVGSVSVETVEHCMSAMAGLQIDNALIQLDGPELPCGDGSAAPFVDPVLEVGLAEQDAARRTFDIVEPILVQDEEAMLAAFPSREQEFQLLFDLDYGPNSHRIKRQVHTFTLRNGNYRQEISRARTYSLKEEAQALWDRGMCRHLTPKDVLVIGDDGPIDNAYRFEDEPVRHKIVDLLGDLYLVGIQVYGRFVASKSGHELNRRMCLKIREQMETCRREEAIQRGRELDIRSIQRIMPHRYPMLMVDRVVEIDGDRRAIGIKNVTINEPFWGAHRGGHGPAGRPSHESEARAYGEDRGASEPGPGQAETSGGTGRSAGPGGRVGPGQGPNGNRQVSGVRRRQACRRSAGQVHDGGRGAGPLIIRGAMQSIRTRHRR
jgi:UDP-3-O-[3-hydroxymyristoyl] N-acetylglucosamine deacetylase/3-hydroxyacyl-[acyl-carrier-protein] dehydratase